jgi:hypothetical protein
VELLIRDSEILRQGVQAPPPELQVELSDPVQIDVWNRLQESPCSNQWGLDHPKIEVFAVKPHDHIRLFD